MRLHHLIAPLFIAALIGNAAAQTPSAGVPTKTVQKPSSRRANAIAPPSHTSFLVGGSDDCANASQNAISGVGTFTVDTTAATDSPQIGTGCVQPHHDVWFQWTATYTGTLEMNLCGGTSSDSVIAAWAGSACPSGTPLACNDDSCGLQSRITFPITNGNVYLLQIGVYGTNPGFAGTFNLIQPPPPPAHDDCATPTAVTGAGPFPVDH